MTFDWNTTTTPTGIAVPSDRMKIQPWHRFPVAQKGNTDTKAWWNDANGDKGWGDRFPQSSASLSDVLTTDQKTIADFDRKQLDALKQALLQQHAGTRNELSSKASHSDSLNVRKRRLPGCIIIGAPKTGSFALITFLGLHPSVAIAEREVMFFNDDHLYSKGLGWYTHQMPPSTAKQLTVEKSPRYLYSPDAPERIYKMNRDVQLVLLVREPIERAMSCYLHRKATKEASGNVYRKTFEDITVDSETRRVNESESCIRDSKYSSFYLKWLHWFPRKQIHVVSGDRLIDNPLPEMRLLEAFLKLKPWFSEKIFRYNADKGFYCYVYHGQEQCFNDKKGRQHPDIDPEALTLLKQYFRPINSLFYDLTGRDLGWNY